MHLKVWSCDRLKKRHYSPSKTTKLSVTASFLKSVMCVILFQYVLIKQTNILLCSIPQSPPCLSQSSNQRSSITGPQEHYPTIYVALQDITDVTTATNIIQTNTNTFIPFVNFYTITATQLLNSLLVVHHKFAFVPPI